MTNHPHRSSSSPVRYVVFSTASFNALRASTSLQGALANFPASLGSTEFFIVFTTRSRDDLDRFDGARLPQDAEIVWRGENELAQRFRNPSFVA